MPFEKGKSGNPNGKPKGALNKATSDVRQLVQKLFSDNFDKIQADFDKLSPRERVNATIKLLDFILPKKFDLDIAAEVTLKQFLELPVSERAQLIQQAKNEGN